MVEPGETARGSLARVIRRIPLALLTIAVLGGCTTFTNEGTAAKLGRAELSIEQLETTLSEQGAASSGALLDAQAARDAINEWWYTTITADPTLVPGYAGLVDQYAEGDGSLDVACIYALQMPDRATADEVAARMTGGETWEDVAAEVSPTVPDSGQQGCSPVAAFNDTIATAIAALSIDGTPIVLDDPSGTSPLAFVVRAYTADEVTLGDLVAPAIASDPQPLADALWVNPAYGRFDTGTFGIQPLG